MKNIQFTEDSSVLFEEYIINKFGYEHWLTICNRYGGQTHYIPKAPSTKHRNSEIIKFYNTVLTTGTNINQCEVYRRLSERYNLSQSHIRRILFHGKSN